MVAMNFDKCTASQPKKRKVGEAVQHQFGTGIQEKTPKLFNPKYECFTRLLFLLIVFCEYENFVDNVCSLQKEGYIIRSWSFDATFHGD